MPETRLKEHSEVVDEAVRRIREIFQRIRVAKEVPLSAVRSDILPIVRQLADHNQLFSVFNALQDKNDYTYRHSVAVGVISSLLGGWLNLSRSEQLQLTTAAVLHDIGKMMIPEHILDKPEQLTEDEYRIMRQHTVYGYMLLRETVGINHRQALVALKHHERMDGSGYPLGLTQEKIDIFSRIVSVADTYHAMISNKVYSDRSPVYTALRQMETDAYKSHDPIIVKLLVRKTMEASTGSTVILTDGREGKIILIQPHDLTRPLVQVGEGFIDLSKEATLNIADILVAEYEEKDKMK